MPEAGSKLQKHAADDLAKLCLQQAKELNALLLDLQARGEDANLAIANRMVGRILGEIYVAALHPIFADYPDLRPKDFP